MKKVIFLPQAEEEMNDSAIFYESQRRGLGREFLEAIKKDALVKSQAAILIS